MTDSLESFDETTTAPCAGMDAPTRRRVLARSDLRISDTGHLRIAHLFLRR
jgi:hypothetical protein